MNPNQPDPDPLDTLFAAARLRRSDTSRAEYGFETRLMARLRLRREDAPVWSTVSWRMAPILAVAVLGLVLLEVHVDGNEQATEQNVYVQNPEAIDLLSSL